MAPLTTEDNDDNWLNAGPVRCPGCGAALYRVDHSPLMDCHFLYCDACPRRVDVSFYDPVFRRVHDEIDPRTSGRFELVMAAIERRLARCACGGAFRHDAWRRCFTCATPLRSIDPPSGVDVWPAAFWLEESDDPASAEAAFTARWIHESDLWRS